jgi:hypothetical protein
MGRINNRYKRDMKTVIQELIHFIEKDRMQSTYTKEQVLELLNFKLKKEKEQNEKAYEQGGKDAWDAFYEMTQSE